MRKRVSVAMATYNGEKFIREQLASILSQLDKDDEIIVSDDGSSDNTLEVINNFKDQRVRIVEGPKMGIKQNFANAISKCSGEIIFLADQDDIWLPGKVDMVVDTFEKEECQCVIHDCSVFNSDTNEIIYPSFFEWRKSKSGIIKNIWKNSYIGCCMAFTANMKKHILPIPDNIEMHDQWVGLMCEKYGKSVFLPKILLRYRRHGKNNSGMKHHGIGKMLENRKVFLREYKNA